jgi:bacterial/archaeal transporter family-2 protein
MCHSKFSPIRSRATMERRRFWSRLGGVPLAVFSGALVTMQSRLNGDLGAALGAGPRAGLLAALVSFGSGLLVLTAVMLARRSWRRSLGRLWAAVGAREIPRWHLLGGVGGACLVASQGLTVGAIGVALFVVAAVAGQTVCALVVDHVGLGRSDARGVTVPRLLGAILAVAAVIVSSASQAAGEVEIVWLAALPLIAGGFNGRVASVSSAWTAAWNNFLVGTAALLVAFSVTLLLPGHLGAPPDHWWLYLGGVIGVFFVVTAAPAVQVYGVLLFGLGVVCGQVSSAVVLDLVLEPERVSWPTGVAAAITVAGVMVAARGGASERGRLGAGRQASNIGEDAGRSARYMR